MLLIAEIFLTIVAWRRGWGGRALLPLGIGIAVAFIFGALAGTGGTSDRSIAGVAIFFDLICVVALIVMIARAPDRLESLAELPRPARPRGYAGSTAPTEPAVRAVTNAPAAAPDRRVGAQP